MSTKFWMVKGFNKTFDKLEDAVTHAKQKVATPGPYQEQQDLYVLEAVKVAKMPIPNITVEDVKVATV